MVNINYDLLTTEVTNRVIPTYQHQSILSLFPSEPIPGGIATEKWAQRYLTETIRAAWTARGFNPNEITLDFKGYALEPTTISQRMTLSEIDLAFYSQHGFLSAGIEELGKNIAYSANMALMQGVGGNDESHPIASQYNYIVDIGSGNGTAVRPIMTLNTAGAKWNHATSGFENMASDCAKIAGALEQKGFNVSTSIVLVPKIAATFLRKTVSEYQNRHVIDYIREQGWLDVIVWDDDFMTTDDGSTAPAIADMDIYAIDLASIVIGYERPETIQLIKPMGIDRNSYVEGEVWPCPLFVPQRINESGTVKTYKGVARLTAVDMSSTS